MSSTLPLSAAPPFAFVGEAGNAILFMMSLLATLLVAMSVVSYAGHCFATVLQDTAAGIDRVMWPEETTADWLLRSLPVTGLLLLWLVPAGILTRPLQPALAPDNGPLAFMMLAVPGLWLFFPVGVLSAFSATTFWAPIRPAVVGKMLRVFPATVGFYLITAALGLGVTFLWYHTLLGTMIWLLPVAAAATGAAILIYARLLGRLAWLMGRLPERKAKAAAPRPVKAAAKRRPRKVLKDRKAIRRATRASNPWAVPKGEPPVDAPNLPVDGYDVAEDDAPRPNPPPKPKAKKFYEPPHPLEIERYGVEEQPPARPADETPLEGSDREDAPRLPPEGPSLAQDAARHSAEAADIEKEKHAALRPEGEYVPAHPLWSSVWGFPWYETSLGAWFTITLGSVALGVGLKAMEQFYPFK
jgi:hypothetical protein